MISIKAKDFAWDKPLPLVNSAGRCCRVGLNSSCCMSSLGHTVLVYDTILCMGCCIGSRAKTSSDAMVERPSARHGSRRVLHGQTNNSYRDWWASSSGEMENNGGNRRPPLQSTPSRSTVLNQGGGRLSDDASSPTFINHALLLWEEQRREWVGSKPEVPSSKPTWEPVLSSEATYDELLTSSRPFPMPIPLPEMVNFLVETWIQEGLYEPHR